jgi:hypothetical protein
MMPSCVSSCTEPRSVRRQLPISFPQRPSRPPRRPILRHCDRKLVVVTLLDSAFTKRHTRNPFRIRIYENCRGSGGINRKSSQERGSDRSSPGTALTPLECAVPKKGGRGVVGFLRDRRRCGPARWRTPPRTRRNIWASVIVRDREPSEGACILDGRRGHR